MAQSTEKEHEPVKFHPLNDMCKSNTEKEVSDESVEKLQERLEHLALVMLDNAEKSANRKEAGRIKADDIENGYQELIKPHNILLRAAGSLEEWSMKMEDMANESPVNSNS